MSKSGDSGVYPAYCREVFSIPKGLEGLGVVENNREIEYKERGIKHEIPDFVELPKNECRGLSSFDVVCTNCGYESKFRYGSCDDPKCFVCHTEWAKKQAHKTALRLLKGCKSTEDRVWHITLSPPENGDNRDLPRGEEYVDDIIEESYDLLKDHGVSGGLVITHYGPEEGRSGVDKYLPEGEYRPHLHIFGHGERPTGPWESDRGDWIVKTLNNGESVEDEDLGFLENGLVYQLSHSMRRAGKHTIRWYGDWSYSVSDWGCEEDIRREAVRKGWYEEGCEEIDGFEVVCKCPKCGGEMVRKVIRDNTGCVEDTEFITYNFKGPPVEG